MDSRVKLEIDILVRCTLHDNHLKIRTFHRVSAAVSRQAALCYGCISERFVINKNANHKLLFCLQADKGQQVTERPQAFFLPLDQTDLIDLETKPEKDLTDLQEALRKNRPGSVLSR